MDLLCLGCSGFIGTAVRERLLASGHSLLLVGRSLPRTTHPQESWVPFESDWMDHLVRVDGIVNFAGEPIAGGIWTPARRRAIEESRIGFCRKIVDRLGHLNRIPKIWINASAVGYYGNRGEELLTEESAAGEGFLAQLCQEWEAEVARSASLGVREVRLRLGSVLAPHGGLLRSLLPIYRLGLGGRLGLGAQYFPWVSLEDVAGVVEMGLRFPLHGAVNVVSPNAVCQEDFSRAFAEQLQRSRWLNIPSWMLNLLPGKMSELFLYSQHVQPNQLLKLDFQFRKPELKQILAELT